MSSELSQVERTARETAIALAPGEVGRHHALPLDEESCDHVEDGARFGWAAARDYGREREEKLRLAEHQASVRHQEERIRREKVEGRERALEDVLQPFVEQGCLGTLDGGVHLFAARAALAASPGERERALGETLAFYAERTNWFNPRPGMAAKPPAERDEGAQARAVLGASQPEVLSERSETEPGEPEGQPRSARITKPDEFRRFLNCPGCGMKRLFSPYEGRCDECRAQPDHEPGEPSDEHVRKIEGIALAGVDALRDVREQRRRKRSLELYGHTGAHIPSIPPVTTETIVGVAVAAALGQLVGESNG